MMKGKAVQKKRLQPTAGESPWYRKADLMRLFGITDRTVEAWVNRGRLPEPRRQGRGWVRWPRAEIDALIAELAKTPEKKRRAG